MLGGGALGEFALGEMGDSLSAPLTFEPVSRIVAGGWSNGRPAEVAVLGAELLWDNGDFIVYDSGDHINWS